MRMLITLMLLYSMLTINAQEDYENLQGTWEMVEIISGDFLKLCDDGDNLKMKFETDTLTFFEINYDTGCLNGIVNKSAYSLDKNTILVLEGDLKWNIVKLNTDELILSVNGESERYKKLE